MRYTLKSFKINGRVIRNRRWRIFESLKNFIETLSFCLGTKWCGQGNKADSYNDLGKLDQLDRCCRAHDNCPLKIHKDMQRWGVRNTAGYTVMDCKCDDAFHYCLQNKVTRVYFNVSQTFEQQCSILFL